MENGGWALVLNEVGWIIRSLGLAMYYMATVIPIGLSQ